MKKGIIAISLLLTGALLITPITNAISQNDVVKDVKQIKVEQSQKIMKTIQHKLKKKQHLLK